MLDKKTSMTLKVLNLICEDDVYKVVDYDGLMSHFPKKVKCDKSKLEDILNYLKAGQYIDIKYKGGMITATSPGWDNKIGSEPV